MSKSKSVSQGDLNTKCLTARFDREYQTDTVGVGAVVVYPDFVKWLREAGFPIEDLSQMEMSVSEKSGGDNSAHLLFEVETLKRPVDEADAVEDEFSFRACSCPDFHFRKFPRVDEGESITSVGECSHIEAWRKRQREESALEGAA